MKKNLYLLGLLIVACSAGCIGRAIREGYYGAKGASGRARPIQSVTVDLADYDAVVVEPFSDDTQGLGNEAFMAVLPAKITEQIIQKTYLRHQGSKVLRITGRLINYDTGTTTDKIASPMEQASTLPGQTNRWGQRRCTGDSQLRQPSEIIDPQRAGGTG